MPQTHKQGYILARVKRGVRPWGGKIVTILEKRIYPNGRVEISAVLGNKLINDGTTNGVGENFWSLHSARNFAPSELDILLQLGREPRPADELPERDFYEGDSPDH